MNIKVQIIVDDETDNPPIVEEVGCFQRGDLSVETIGLMLQEGKELLANLQQSMVKHQIAAYFTKACRCMNCHSTLARKDSKTILFRSLFGNIEVNSPRFYTCKCQSAGRKSFSPLTSCLSAHTAPELLYLQSKWAALMSYGLTTDLLNEVLPLQVNRATVMRHTHQIARRIENELGDEQVMYMKDANATGGICRCRRILLPWELTADTCMRGTATIEKLAGSR